MLTQEQEYIKDRAIEWWRGGGQVFQYTGGPGTGKSFLLKYIIKELNIPWYKIAPMAYTGQAAIVMRSYGLDNARTIHSWLYEPVIDYVRNPDGTFALDPYLNKPIKKLMFVPKNLDDIDLFVIDEGSMVPISMKQEIESRGKKILVTGDIDQLPPIYGDSAYLTSGQLYRLTEVMRQKKNSPIIYLAHRALQGLDIEPGIYGNCKVIYDNELTDQEIIDSDIILCGRNATREMINNNYRHNILQIERTLPVYGERMICRKNNWQIESDGINIANGLLGIVSRSPGLTDFDGKIYKMDFLPLMSDGVFENLECDYKYLIGTKEEKEEIKNDRYSVGEKFDYGYAITTHMSQGGQFSKGIYVEEYLRRDIQNRLNFTGITRFKDSMIYVKKAPKNYFIYNR
ncbi:MAG: ATP-dependent RecD-like DNA helicase [Romboutsia timonensis]|uniref:ATP-dependent DNA helicase n=1 Tax=Romboutsia timonensis TaxID=1776391 RepID=UPI0039A1E646